MSLTSREWLARGSLVLVALCCSVPETAAAEIARPGAAQARTELVTFAIPGEVPNGRSAAPDPSFDGRFVVFVSWATNLVEEDTNRVADIFLRDRLRDTTERVSVTSGEEEASRASDRPHISASGRFVAFASAAANLVPRDTNRMTDVFVRDLVEGTTERVSVATDRRQGNAPIDTVSISGNGRFVVFSSRATTLDRSARGPAMKIFVHDREKRTTRVLRLGGGAPPNGDSHASWVSRDGRFVAFRSFASNLVPGDTNAVADAFVRDRKLGRTTRVSVSSSGVQGDLDTFRPQISNTGRFAVFRSFAANLVPGDTNLEIDVFVRDLRRGLTTRVSTSTTGEQANARPEIFPSISGDGRRVVFGSFASNLVAGDTNRAADVFLHDGRAHWIRRVSLGAGNQQTNGSSYHARVSGNGRVVAFASEASNLVGGDRSRLADIYVRLL
jgi:Tol biopolymer transport system component